MTNIDKVMLQTFLVFLGLELVTLIYGLMYPGDFEVPNIVLGSLFGVFSYFLAIYSIRILRGNEVKDSNKQLGIIGYFWRSIIIHYFSLMLAVVLFVIVPFVIQIPSITYTLVINTVISIFTIFSTWLFFSRNRKAQLHWVMGIINR